MRRFSVWAVMLFALVVTAACADAPTAPDGGRVDDVGHSALELEPITVIGKPKTGCDPYTDLNWCQGDGEACMTSIDPGTTDPELVYVSSCPGGGGAPGDGGSPGGGSDGDGDGSIPCDPQTDPDCEKPLTTVDATTIANALSAFVRSTAEIPDTTAQRQCAEMLQQFFASNSEGNVFRGGSNTGHYGAMYNNRIHFDPRHLDAAAAGDVTAQREIANSALHEAAHVLGFHHPAGQTWQGTQDYYSDAPFNLLSPGPNSCIRY